MGIGRTFPRHTMFQHDKGKQMLYNILKAYAVSEPAVGYCQGMGFMPGLLLIYMTPDEALAVMYRVVRDMGFSGFYSVGFPLLMRYLRVHDLMVSRMFPRLFQQFRDNGITASFYATEWYQTLFAASFPCRYTIRVLDMFFAEGGVVLVRVALALIKLLERDLMKMSVDEGAVRLKHVQQHIAFSPEELVEASIGIGLSDKKFQKLLRESADELPGMGMDAVDAGSSSSTSVLRGLHKRTKSIGSLRGKLNNNNSKKADGSEAD